MGARPQRGIQSVEVGGRLLLALADAGVPLPLKDLAAAAGMTPAKAHPYLVSFGKLGLIVQNEVSGHYGLGPLAVQLGLISLQQIDPVRLASERLPALAREIGQTVAIAVWGNRGATIVRSEEGPQPIHVGIRHGTVLSLHGTASGRLFAAWLPPELLARAGEAPAQAGPAAGGTAFGEADRAAIRRQGVAAVVDAAVQGVAALAAPVFDAGGRLALALTVVGPARHFDVGPDGPAACLLRKVAAELSRQLGARVGGAS